MNEIRKEYPEGQRQTEMVLVEMLRERRSWDDYRKISDALWNIRFHAKSMQKEHERLSADSGCAGQVPPNMEFERINRSTPGYFQQ